MAGVAGFGGGAGGTGRTRFGGPGYNYPYTGITYAVGGGGGWSGGGGSSFGDSYNGHGGAGVNDKNTPGGQGEPGTIIFAIPTPNYTGIHTGASVSNPPAAPGLTVLTYNGPGSYTA